MLLIQESAETATQGRRVQRGICASMLRKGLKAARGVRLLFHPAKRSTRASLFDLQLKAHHETPELSSNLRSVLPLMCSDYAITLSQPIASSGWNTLHSPHKPHAHYTLIEFSALERRYMDTHLQVV